MVPSTDRPSTGYQTPRGPTCAKRAFEASRAAPWARATDPFGLHPPPEPARLGCRFWPGISAVQGRPSTRIRCQRERRQTVQGDMQHFESEGCRGCMGGGPGDFRWWDRLNEEVREFEPVPGTCSHCPCRCGVVLPTSTEPRGWVGQPVQAGSRGAERSCGV